MEVIGKEKEEEQEEKEEEQEKKEEKRRVWEGGKVLTELSHLDPSTHTRSSHTGH